MILHKAEKLWEGVRLLTLFSPLCYSAEQEGGLLRAGLIGETSC